MEKEAKINIILNQLEEEINIASFTEDRVKRAIRKALRIIEETEQAEEQELFNIDLSGIDLDIDLDSLKDLDFNFDADKAEGETE